MPVACQRRARGGRGSLAEQRLRNCTASWLEPCARQTSGLSGACAPSGSHADPAPESWACGGRGRLAQRCSAWCMAWAAQICDQPAPCASWQASVVSTFSALLVCQLGPQGGGNPRTELTTVAAATTDLRLFAQSQSETPAASHAVPMHEHAGAVSNVLVFANFELLSDNATRLFVSRLSANHRKTVWWFCNHGGPTARAVLREPARWLAGPAAPTRIEWVLRANPFKHCINGCGRDPTAMRRMVESVRKNVPMRLHVLDNMVPGEWSNSIRANNLSRLAHDCLPGIPFQPLKERDVRKLSNVTLSRTRRKANGTKCQQVVSLSTGAVAALYARRMFPEATVYGVGFTGHCSFLNAKGTPSDKCSRFHEFGKERSLLRSAGVKLVARPSWLTHAALGSFIGSKQQRYSYMNGLGVAAAAAGLASPFAHDYVCADNLNVRKPCIKNEPCPLQHLTADACRVKCSQHAPACGIFMHNRYAQCFLKRRDTHEDISPAELRQDLPVHKTVSCYRKDADDEYRVTRASRGVVERDGRQRLKGNVSRRARGAVGVQKINSGRLLLTVT